MNNQPHRVIVKQSYAVKCEQNKMHHFKTVNSKIFAESSRILRSDGTVVKMMNDGQIEIYHANGMIYRKEFDLIAMRSSELVQLENIEMEMSLSKSRTSIHL